MLIAKFALGSVWGFIMIMSLTRLFTIMIKDPLFVTSNYSVKKEIIGINIEQILYFLSFWCSLSFSPFLCSVNGTKLLQYWQKLSEKFLLHFDEDFAQQLFAIVWCQDCMLILYLLHQGCHLSYEIFGTIFLLSDHMWLL